MHGLYIGVTIEWWQNLCIEGMHVYTIYILESSTIINLVISLSFLENKVSLHILNCCLISQS